MTGCKKQARVGFVNGTYSAEPKELDQIVRNVAATTEDGRVRLRFQPTIYSEGQYKPWTDVTWILQCETADEAIAVKDTLRECFAALIRVGEKGPEGLAEVGRLLATI